MRWLYDKVTVHGSFPLSLGLVLGPCLPAKWRLPQAPPGPKNYSDASHFSYTMPCRIVGQVVVTVSRGRVVWENGVLSVPPGSGRFLPLPLFGPLFEGMEEQVRRAYHKPYGLTPVHRHGDGAVGTGVMVVADDKGKDEL